MRSGGGAGALAAGDQTKSGPTTTLSTVEEAPSRTRLESHQAAALRTLHGDSSPVSRKAATSPSVG